MANFDGSLEAVDCHIRCVRYDMVLESKLAPSQMPHQATYDVVATPIRSCGLSFSLREIRYGAVIGG
eukprot:scaffold30124_cov120-Skeletonema_dohrnii-CCMP3373.AAC.1